jgi:hypothetical protein
MRLLKCARRPLRFAELAFSPLTVILRDGRAFCALFGAAWTAVEGPFASVFGFS